MKDLIAAAAEASERFGDDECERFAAQQRRESCFYSPSTHTCIDTIRPDGLSSVFGKTLEEIRFEEPDAAIWSLDAAWKHQTDAAISPPTLVTEERFMEMLEVLPPQRWRTGEGKRTESFNVLEMIIGDVGTILCRIGSDYYELTDRVSLTHEEIVSKCKTVNTK